MESVLKPEDTYLKKSLKSCWATSGVTKNNKYYWYLSVGTTNIGVVVGDSPAGPWTNPLGKPLIDETMTPAPERDPEIFMDDDGKAYIIFGAGKYYVARLNEDMISLAETPRNISLAPGSIPPSAPKKTSDQPLTPEEVEKEKLSAPYMKPGRFDDKPSLHKRNGIYYLSYGSWYAMSENIYGPYNFKGSVLDAKKIAPEFSYANMKKPRPMDFDRHGNFFTWKNQWYYTCNDQSQPGRTSYWRDSIITYVHYKDNGEMVPVRIDAIGVGQYDAAQGRIEAEDFFEMHDAEKRECADGFEVRGLRNGSRLVYPKVRNLPQNATLSLHVANGQAKGVKLEIREGGATGKLLGTSAIPATDGWDKYQTIDCTLKNEAGKKDLCFVVKGDQSESLRLDWWKAR
jgi:arabinoxylan arabinofuranohydrolase